MRRFSQRGHLVTLSEINITPLLDLAFVLLIIFIITTPLITPENGLNLKLPVGRNTADRPPENLEAKLGARPRHGIEVHAPETGFLADEQAELVSKLHDVPVVGIVHEADIVGAERLYATHILLHLCACQREALALPHVMTADAV